MPIFKQNVTLENKQTGETREVCVEFLVYSVNYYYEDEYGIHDENETDYVEIIGFAEKNGAPLLEPWKEIANKWAKDDWNITNLLDFVSTE